MYKGLGRQMPENKGSALCTESRNTGRKSLGELLGHSRQKEKHG